jgi:hypothetical protein
MRVNVKDSEVKEEEQIVNGRNWLHMDYIEQCETERDEMEWALNWLRDENRWRVNWTSMEEPGMCESLMSEVRSEKNYRNALSIV